MIDEGILETKKEEIPKIKSEINDTLNLEVNPIIESTVN